MDTYGYVNPELPIYTTKSLLRLRGVAILRFLKKIYALHLTHLPDSLQEVDLRFWGPCGFEA